MKNINLLATGSKWDHLFTIFPGQNLLTELGCLRSTQLITAPSSEKPSSRSSTAAGVCGDLWRRCCSTSPCKAHYPWLINAALVGEGRMEGASSSLEELHGKPAPVPEFAGTSKNGICIVDLNFNHSISKLFTRMVYTRDMQNRVVYKTIQDSSLISVVSLWSVKFGFPPRPTCR